MYKRWIVLVFTVVLLLTMQVSVFATGDVSPSIILEGKAIDAPASVSYGALYLPLRAIAESIGYDVEWTRKGNTISLTKTGSSILIELNDSKVTKDGHTYYMDGDYTGDIQSGIIFIRNRIYMVKGIFSELLGLNTIWDNKSSSASLEKIIYNDISIKPMKETSEDKYLKLTIQYPEISGLDKKSVQDSINSVIIKAADDAKKEGVKYAEEMKQTYDSGYTGSPNQCETYFDYRLKYNRNGLLSIVFLDYQYTGGAHGMTVQSSHTFSLDTGKDYELKDLFKSGADYVSTINGAVKLRMAEKVKAGILPDQPLTPFKTIKDNQDYYLSDNGIVIYFQQYEYFPYASGIQEFTVVFDKMKDILKSDFGFFITAGVK